MKTLCCSDKCEKRFECARADINNEGMHCVENFYSFGTGTMTENGCEIEHWCGELGNYKMFENKNKIVDDIVYMKQDRLDVYYNSGKSEDGTVYCRPCLTVARNNYKDMTIENKFYDDEAVELYKKLIEYRR